MKGGELFGKMGHGVGGAAFAAAWVEGVAFILGLDQAVHAVARVVAVVNINGVMMGGVVFGVESGIADGVIDVAVIIDVASGDAVPPAEVFGEPGFFGGLGEISFLVEEEFDGAPLVRDEEINPAVGIGVGPKRGGNEPGSFEAGSFFGRGFDEFYYSARGRLVDQEAAVGGDGIFAGDDAASDEEIEVAVAVEVGGNDATGIVSEAGEGLVWRGIESAFSVVKEEAVLGEGIVFVVFVTSAGEVEICVAIGVGIEEEDAYVFGVFEFVEGGGAFDAELAFAVIEKDGAGLALGTGDEEILAAIAIDISEGDSRSGL